MFTEDKITEIFCMADDFCQFFAYLLLICKQYEYYRNKLLTFE